MGMYDPSMFPFTVEQARFCVRLEENQVAEFQRLAEQFGATTDPRKSWLQISGNSDDGPVIYSLNAWLDQENDWQGFESTCKDVGINIRLADRPGTVKASPTFQQDFASGDYM